MTNSLVCLSRTILPYTSPLCNIAMPQNLLVLKVPVSKMVGFPTASGTDLTLQVNQIIYYITSNSACLALCCSVDTQQVPGMVRDSPFDLHIYAASLPVCLSVYLSIYRLLYCTYTRTHALTHTHTHEVGWVWGWVWGWGVTLADKVHCHTSVTLSFHDRNWTCITLLKPIVWLITSWGEVNTMVVKYNMINDFFEVCTKARTMLVW